MLGISDAARLMSVTGDRSKPPIVSLGHVLLSLKEGSANGHSEQATQRQNNMRITIIPPYQGARPG